MNKRIRHKLSKITTYFIIPFGLLLLWFALTIIFNSYGSLSITTYPLNEDTDSFICEDKRLLAGDSCYGEFVASDNNLGIISIRFYTFNNINTDQLLFLIKEKKAKEMYYQNSYNVDQFQDNELFTFGFPQIENSKGKRYEFRIVSKNGKSKDSVAVSRRTPAVVSKYQLPKADIKNDQSLITKQLTRKFYEAHSNIDFIISSIIYLLPFIIYLFWIMPVMYFFERNTKIPYKINYEQFVLGIITGIIILIILFVEQLSSNVATLILLGAWIYFFNKAKLNNTINFIYALSFLIYCPLILTIGFKGEAERAAIWAIYFIFIGVTLELIEINKISLFNRKNLIQQ